jgi:signal peptidase I
MKTLIKEVLIPFLVALAIFFGFQATLVQYVIQQTSMIPTLVEGERLFVSKVSYLIGEPKRGDIIVFHPPDSPKGTPLIKRVIGLPGERVEVKSGSVYINGVALKEPYIREVPRYEMEEFTIPAGHYFVLGDNRNQSRDSHSGWTAEKSMIVGKALFVVWPPGEWGSAPNYSYSRQ